MYHTHLFLLSMAIPPVPLKTFQESYFLSHTISNLLASRKETKLKEEGKEKAKCILTLKTKIWVGWGYQNLTNLFFFGVGRQEFVSNHINPIMH